MSFSLPKLFVAENWAVVLGVIIYFDYFKIQFDKNLKEGGKIPQSINVVTKGSRGIWREQWSDEKEKMV